MMPSQITLPSPAKINHFLHINGQREDGYHLLQTLFQFLEYGDDLHFKTRDDQQIVLDPPTPLNIPLETNLVYRAAHALQKAANVQKGITISLEKRLPIGGGLGGGSSNAATTLIALNALWGINWPLERLKTVGLPLGADVNVFLEGRGSFGEGIGEQLTPIDIPEEWIVVLIPDCQVISAKMYSVPDLTRNTPTFRIGTLIEGEINQILSTLKNDFEPVVRRHYPEVDEAMKWLSNFGRAQLSGSGASVFVTVASFEKANTILRQLPPHMRGFISKGTNRSPLFEAAEKLGFKFNDWGVAKR